jgi:hypothetical protein
MKVDLKSVNRVVCIMGLHTWHEPRMNFFNPQEIHEECLVCGATRTRFDRRNKRDVWRKRRRWFL